MQNTKILLADDHKIIIDGLRRLLTDKFEVVGAVTDGMMVVETAKKTCPDLVLLDITMPLMNGLDAARVLQNEVPNAKIIFLTMHADSYFVLEAFRVGASGYLLKQSAGDELLTAIHQVLLGRHYLSPLVTKDFISLLLESKKKLINTILI